MTIEDIHYLYKHSSKENIVLLIDSSRRNLKHWPTPSEFVVEFPEPFKNVIGVEVLNASIPRTTFVVDTHNGLLQLFSFTYNVNNLNVRSVEDAFREYNLPPNDFSTGEQMISSLTTLMREKDNTFVVDANILDLDADIDISQKGFVKLTSTKSPFIFDSLRSTISKTLGFSMLSRKDVGQGLYTLKSDFLSMKSTIYSVLNETIQLQNEDLLEDVYESDLTVQPGSTDLNVTFEHEKKISSGAVLTQIKINGQEYDLQKLESYFFQNELKIKDIVEFLESDDTSVHVLIHFKYLFNSGRQIFDLDEDYTFVSKLDGFTVNDQNPIQLSETEDSGNGLLFTSDEDDLGICLRSMNVKIDAIANVELTDETNNKTVFILMVSQHETNIQKVILQCEYSLQNGEYFLKYDSDIPTVGNPFNQIKLSAVEYLLYFMRTPIITDNLNTERIKVIDVLRNDEESNQLENALVSSTEFKIVPPGMVNMATENYVTLRCPEIENHTRGAYDANDVSPGLAIFSVDVRSGYATNKNEFFSVKYKEFHPIGKLSRLHFRFERKSDKNLYNFKGVDLHFILSLKMLAAEKLNERILEYTLNKNYNPDYQGFMQSEFDNVESDEEINESLITEKMFRIERDLQNLKSREDEYLIRDDSSSETSSDEYSTDQSDD